MVMSRSKCRSPRLTALSASDEPLPESDEKDIRSMNCEIKALSAIFLVHWTKKYIHIKLLIYQVYVRLLRFTNFLSVPVSLFGTGGAKLYLYLSHYFTKPRDTDQ